MPVFSSGEFIRRCDRVILSHCDKVTLSHCHIVTGPPARDDGYVENRVVGVRLHEPVHRDQRRGERQASTWRSRWWWRWVRVWDFSTCSTSSECVVGPVIHLVEPVRRVWKFPLKDPSFQVIAKHRLSDRYLIVRKTNRIVGIPQIEVEGNTPHYNQP